LPLATSLGSVFGHDSPFGRADRPSFKVISTAGAIVALLSQLRARLLVSPEPVRERKREQLLQRFCKRPNAAPKKAR
jgi:hypothetical protein